MKKNILTRRDFLKVAGVTSASLALSACGVKATNLPTSFATSTISVPTQTAVPSITPSPTSDVQKIFNDLLQESISRYAKPFGLNATDVFNRVKNSPENQKTLKDINGASFYVIADSDIPLLCAETSNNGDLVWQDITLRYLGDKAGLTIGTSVDNTDSQYKTEKYRQTGAKEFSAIVPMNAFNSDRISKEAQTWIDYAAENKQAIRIQAFWSQDFVGKHIEKEYFSSRLQEIMPYIINAREQGVNVQITLANEPFQYWKGQAVWAGEWDNKNGFYDLYKREWISEAYITLYDISTQFGLRLGKDFTVIGVAERGIDAQGYESTFAVLEIKRIKQNIIQRLTDKGESYSLQSLPFDIGIMFHIGKAEKDRDIVVPFEILRNENKGTLTKQFVWINEQTGSNIHLAEISDLLDTKDTLDDVRIAYETIFSAALDSKVVQDAFFWSTMTFYTENGWVWRNDLLDKNYQPLAPYYGVMQALLKYLVNPSA